MKITQKKFGVLSDGRTVHLYTVKNDSMSFSCTDYGCTLTSIVLNNADGTKTDVLLGYSTLEGYLNSKFCFGTIVGRFANRISRAAFTLDGTKYRLDKNDGPNTLHGGFSGYDKMLWKGVMIEGKDCLGVRFRRVSPDGEQGFPGNVRLEVLYLLDAKNNLTCRYTAQTDAPTPINLTNHAYFNLAGGGSIEKHLLRMNSSQMLEVSPKLIPTGKILDVTGTAFDFTTEKAIGKDIKETGAGYDHCYLTELYEPDNPDCALPGEAAELVEFAVVTEPASGRAMSVYTNLPGCQFYSGNFIKGVVGKNGTVYQNHDALCLETQCFPDSPNRKEFPSCILTPDRKLVARTVYSFN